MHNSDLITPQHRARGAVIYIRQSTPHQVLSHQESLRLQYALHERAHELGWPHEAIAIIDDDLGLTAAEQVQVRPVDHQHASGLAHASPPRGRRNPSGSPARAPDAGARREGERSPRARRPTRRVGLRAASRRRAKS